MDIRFMKARHELGLKKEEPYIFEKYYLLETEPSKMEMINKIKDLYENLAPNQEYVSSFRQFLSDEIQDLNIE